MIAFNVYFKAGFKISQQKKSLFNKPALKEVVTMGNKNFIRGISIGHFKNYRRAIKLLVFILPIAIIFLFADAATIGAASQPWQPLPLRTEAQKEAGMPGGEGMQMVFSMSYAPSNPNIAYFVSDTSQVWKSEDGGYSWQSKRNGFRSFGGVSLAVDPLNEDVVFVSGSRQHSSYTSKVDGIYRTLDGGGSWQLVKQTAYYRNKEGQHFVFDPRSFNGVRHMTIYAGTHKDGLLRSVDGGDTWTVIGLDGIRILDIEINVDNVNNAVVLYLATQQEGLKKGTDNGIDPVTIAPIGNLPVYPSTIALKPQSDPANDIIYAALETSKVYKSTDGGQTFIKKISGLINNLNYKIIDISKADPNYLYVSVDGWGGNNPFYSHNGGDTWQQPTDLDEGNLSITQGVFLASVTGPHPTDRDTALHNFAGGSRISITSNGGQTWGYSGNGYMGARRKRNKTSTYFDLANPDRKIFFLADFGPAITENNGDTWELLPIPWNGGKSTPVGAVDPNNPNKIITPIGGETSQNLAISIDGGQTWTVSATATGDFRFISFHPQDSNYVYAGTYKSGWISNNGGNSWTSTGTKSIRAVFPGNGNIVYAFEPCGDVYNPPSECTENRSVLWRSDNKGVNWTQVAISFKLDNLYDLDIDPLDDNRLYAACNYNLYVYDGTIPDTLIRWSGTGKSGGIPTENFGNGDVFAVNSVVVDPNNPNIVYAGMWAPGDGHRKRFIYRSVDYGQTWQDIGYNLDEYSVVWSLAVDPSNGDLYMNTAHGNYVLTPDSDRDGILDDGDNSGVIGDNKCTGGNTVNCDDNCSQTANSGQQDTDGDLYGNMCDCDLDNDDVVGFRDFNIFKAAWLSNPSSPNWNADADFDSNNSVGVFDFNIFKTRWLTVAPWE